MTMQLQAAGVRCSICAMPPLHPTWRSIGRGGTRLALLAIAATCAPAATAWDSLAPFSAGVAVESIGPPGMLARGDGAWVLYSPTLSVDCSPPRGCYAKTQRIHYDFSCFGRYAVITERISMDLNGNVVKHERFDAAAGLTPSYDAGAILLLDTFCPLPDRGDR